MTAFSFKPGLYLVATPIGNLGDITLRALEALRAADLILCEDTRVTGQLLKHYDIQKPLQVYNNQTESRDHGDVIRRIQDGARVALVSDAGMPLLSDPGYQLVQACQAAEVMVTSMPGASAILTGLQLSGLPSDAFLFLGFLPNKSGERQARFREISGIKATVILFERADRVPDVLNDIQIAIGGRSVAVARELTKMFEDVRRGKIDAVQQSIKDNPIKGEVVLLIGRASDQGTLNDDEITALLATHMADKPLKTAVDDVAGLTGVQRRHVYDLALKYRDSKDQ